jgi:NAD(P)-dependent dehydrogenase (short-subunit alcohol dehydrogenase family)
MSSEQTVMPSEQKVAIVTGASQGIGAGAVQAYRKLGYAVVANSRHISSSADPGVLAVPGDVADPRDRRASGRSGGRTFRPGGHAG